MRHLVKRTPWLLVWTALGAGALSASGCASASDGGAVPSEATGRAHAAAALPGTATGAGNLAARLQVLNVLPSTMRAIEGLAYFKDTVTLPARASGPNASLGLVMNDGLFFTQGLGSVNGQEPTPQIAYRLASDTKLFTGAEILKFAREHSDQLTLDDHASAHYAPTGKVALPANRMGLTYPAGAPAACTPPCDDGIHVRDLLTQSGGFMPDAVDWNVSKSTFDGDLAGVELCYYPGYNRIYSNTNYEVLGRVLESVSSTTYESLLTQQILTPLGMTHTGFEIAPFGQSFAPPFAQTFNATTGDITYASAPTNEFIEQDPMWAAGGLISTVADMASFLRMELSSNSAIPGSFPLTQADLYASQHELESRFLPTLFAPSANDPCVICVGYPAFLYDPQYTGASWWEQNGGTPDPVLGNWVAMSGGLTGYVTPLDLAPSLPAAPNEGVASIVLMATTPDPQDPDTNRQNAASLMATRLLKDAATAIGTPAPLGPLPTVVQGLLSLIDGWSDSLADITATTQLFADPAYARFQGNLPLGGYASSLGDCSTFTVQRIDSAVSARITLQCAKGTLPIAIAASPSAPFRITSFEVLGTTATAPRQEGLRPGIAIVGGTENATIPVATSNGDGTWEVTTGSELTGDTQFTVYARQSGAIPLQGDFDGDGFPDLALAGGAGWSTIPVAFGDGDGFFHGTNLGVTSGFTGFPAAAAAANVKMLAGDFDGDGYADIALTGGAGWDTIPVAFSNGDGTFHATNQGMNGSPVHVPAEAGSGALPVAGDFDGDGKTDLALVGVAAGQIPVALSNGDGTFTGRAAVVSEVVPFYAPSLAAGVRRVSGDFNGDGLIDIALVGPSTLVVAFNTGSVSFVAVGCTVSNGSSFTPFAGADGMRPVAQDFDGDGRTDLALTGGTQTATIPVAFSNGTGPSPNGGYVCAFSAYDEPQTTQNPVKTFTAYAAQSGARPVAMP